MGKPFRTEVDYLPEAIRWALGRDVSRLRRAVRALSDSNIIAVGSGGSFSAATYWAQQHELHFGKLSKASTPIEFTTRTSRLLDTSVVLLSAEGRNSDIVAAAQSVHGTVDRALAVTLTLSNPLGDVCTSRGVAAFVGFDMPWGKDGYLATNSLVALTTMAALTYSDGSEVVEARLGTLDAQWVTSKRVQYRHSEVLKSLAPNQSVLLLHGVLGHVAAIDLESKLTESALAICQAVDFRQFAHGRHLQLDRSLPKPLVIAIVSPRDDNLARATLDLIPQSVPRMIVEISGSTVLAGIEGVLHAILVTEAIAENRGIDPGQPSVPEYCRELHALDIRPLIPSVAEDRATAIERKLPGVRAVPSAYRKWSGAALDFCERLSRARFKALVCDFDGTFCETDRRFEGLDTRLVPKLIELLDAGIIVGFATGRGDSLYTDLRQKLPSRVWGHILVGYYTGSVVEVLDTAPTFPACEPPLHRLEEWLQDTGICHRLGTAPTAHCGQLGLRVNDQRSRLSAIEAIRNWLQAQSLYSWRIYCSGHSIDIITNSAGKERVVEVIADRIGCNQAEEILRIGDSGDYGGNDFELLGSGLGLSVGTVSSNPAGCWNLLPTKLSGVAGTLHYLTALELHDRFASFRHGCFDHLLSHIREDTHSV